jgi:hypothetical protein
MNISDVDNTLTADNMLLEWELALVRRQAGWWGFVVQSRRDAVTLLAEQDPPPPPNTIFLSTQAWQNWWCSTWDRL